jgi:hypothetical protein
MSEGRGSFRLIGPGAHSRQKSVNRLGAFNPILPGSGAGHFETLPCSILHRRHVVSGRNVRVRMGRGATGSCP